MRRTLRVWIAGVAFGLMTAMVCRDLRARGPEDSQPPVITEVEDLRQLWLKTYADLPEPQPLTGTRCDDLNMTLLAKAQPDECFFGIGEQNIYPFDFSTQDCSGGVPKVNESYVFGLARCGDRLWFGTVANMMCLVSNTVFEETPGGMPTIEIEPLVCESGESVFGQQHGLPTGLGDWRPPSIYVYDTTTGELTEKTPEDDLIWQTMGLRSAACLGGVVLLAGPTLMGMGGPAETTGITVFAFNGQTGDYLGSALLEEYGNIRKWVEVNGVLYCGVMNTPTLLPDPDLAHTGSVLRWAPTDENLFNFERVAWLDGAGVELAEHEGRLFVTTWPDFSRVFDDQFGYAGLWMSPVLGSDGLHEEDTDEWQKVWSAADYEPDEVTARMYNGGALASFDGYLYWGSLHSQMLAGMAHAMTYGLVDPEGQREADKVGIMTAMLATHRPISIFRGRDFGTADQRLEVLYGMEAMPVSVENPRPWGLERKWVMMPNGMGPPLYGPAGFGNSFNTYTWTMAVYKGQLYVGTQDWGYMASEMFGMMLGEGAGALPLFDRPDYSFGGDLWRFPSSNSPAEAVDIAGVGNWANYGIRTMVVADDVFYLGMANAMNLLTDPDDELPEGGWELIRLTSDCDLGGIKGDFDGDGVFGSETDWPQLLECFSRLGATYTSPCCRIDDFDDDADVDLPDLLAFYLASLSQQ